MHKSSTRYWQQKLSVALAGILLLPFLYSGHDHPNRLQQAQQRGNLTLLTRNGASSYFQGREDETGPEYELAAAFAQYLGLEINVAIAPTYSDLGHLLKSKQGELIAANLTRTPARELEFDFGPDYDQAEMIVVYRSGKARPHRIADLIGLKLAVIAGSSYEDLLQQAVSTYPALTWQSDTARGIEGLLQAISDGQLDATLVDSNIFKIHGQFYPRLKIGFSLTDQQPQAWAFLPGNDDSLLQQARLFFSLIQGNGTLAAIQSRYYDNDSTLNRVGMVQFMQQVRKRLPTFMHIFQDVAAVHELDWRLLAAMGYQESHWDPNATSVTGVRGLMMLTLRTAKQLGINNRLDPQQSIKGGARYFVRMHNRTPSRIPEPDRTWMALAAYNMGWGHLEDARILTQKQGGNPDLWQDVNEHLPLLSQEQWYRQTRNGYARGYQAVQYVSNIRSYFDTLVWLETRAHPVLMALL